MLNIPKIVETGGPCAGKTSALAAIAQFCQNVGRHPVIITEAVTDLANAGFDKTRPEFQTYVLKKILFETALREEAYAAGHFPAEPVFIYDRGLCDGRAYVDEETFAAALKAVGLSLVQARDEYSGVIFLDSAAVGAEEFYTLENNTVRDEGLDAARILNERTKDAWMGTPHFRHIPNRPGVDFDGKITECLQALARILGVPIPLENERKFLVHNFRPDMLPGHAAPIDIIQTYLVGKEEQVERVRARGQHNHYLYFNTIKVGLPTGGSHELDNLVSRGMFDDLLIRRDTTRLPVHKTRKCFRHAEHYCELDFFHGHREGLIMLEVEVHEMTDHVELPRQLGEFEEVTGDPRYSNYALALPV